MRKRQALVQKKKFYFPFILTIGACLAFFLIFLFFGLPILAKLSLFFGEFFRKEINIISDHTPPFPPQLETPYTATNSAQLTIQGTAESDSTIELFLNEQVLEKILTGKDGTFTKRVTLKEGENTINAQAIDQAGNRSKHSETIVILYKKDKPLLEIKFPEKDEFETKEEEIEIKGQTDSGVNLTINGRLVFVETDGNFSYLLPLVEGENLIEIIATDEAGNQTKVERKIVFLP